MEVNKISQSVNVDGNSSDFSGNGNYKDFSFDFENIGNYEVCLTIYTNKGCTDKFCDSIEVFNQYDNTCQANYEFKIEGGGFSWNLLSSGGKKIDSGIFLIFIVSENGNEDLIGKILVI